MSRKYKIRNQDELYFVTFTVVNWIDFFIRNEYKDVFLESLKYCQKEKGLEVYAYCIMTSHAHLIVGRCGDQNMEDIIRDLKSYTSKYFRKLLEDKDAIAESRREWITWMMKREGSKNSNNNNFQFWQQHNHPIELATNDLKEQKLNYIHQNPVEAGIVSEPEHYLFSSARDYCGLNGMLDVIILE